MGTTTQSFRLFTCTVLGCFFLENILLADSIGPRTPVDQGCSDPNYRASLRQLEKQTDFALRQILMLNGTLPTRFPKAGGYLQELRENKRNAQDQGQVWSTISMAATMVLGCVGEVFDGIAFALKGAGTAARTEEAAFTAIQAESTLAKSESGVQKAQAGSAAAIKENTDFINRAEETVRRGAPYSEGGMRTGRSGTSSELYRRGWHLELIAKGQAGLGKSTQELSQAIAAAEEARRTAGSAGLALDSAQAAQQAQKLIAIQAAAKAGQSAAQARNIASMAPYLAVGSGSLQLACKQSSEVDSKILAQNFPNIKLSTLAAALPDWANYNIAGDRINKNKDYLPIPFQKITSPSPATVKAIVGTGIMNFAQQLARLNKSLFNDLQDANHPGWMFLDVINRGAANEKQADILLKYGNQELELWLDYLHQLDQAKFGVQRLCMSMDPARARTESHSPTGNTHSAK